MIRDEVMDYTLLSRFQGSWLGSAIGEALANEQEQLGKAHREQLKIIQYQPSPWLEARNSIALALIKSQESSLELSQVQNNLKSCSSSDRVGLFLLPLIMFYVDDFKELREIVTQNNSYSQKEAENIQNGLIWGNTISLAFREKLDVNNLIESILFSASIDSTLLMKQLKVVDLALKTGKTINKVVEELSSAGTSNQIALALSLYCFGVAPENFELSTGLAINNKYRNRNVAALTGALSGAYNSFIGIPLKSRMLARQNPTYQQAMTIVTKLFNIWSGVYTSPKHNSQLTIVAAPRTIQTRSSLKIISQTE